MGSDENYEWKGETGMDKTEAINDLKRILGVTEITMQQLDEIAEILEALRDDAYEEGRQDGRVEGEEYGRIEGFDEGKREGIEEGIDDERYRVSSRIMEHGYGMGYLERERARRIALGDY
jgi:predicted transposase YdaD